MKFTLSIKANGSGLLDRGRPKSGLSRSFEKVETLRLSKIWKF